MRAQSRTLVLFFLLSVLSSTFVNGSPVTRKSRTRRSGISDQRLAELETLITLSNMRSKYLTVPVAYGVIDPARIGKRKRSYDDYFNDHPSTESRRNSDANFVHRLLRRLRNSQWGDSRNDQTVDE